MKKKFILGIGSQRAGSTFIARLLNQHPRIAIHPLKELHYFDTIFNLRNESVLKEFSKNQLTREINKLCDVQKLDFVTPSWQWYLRTNLHLYTTPIENVQYPELFSDIQDNKDIDFIGESTPEYMLLNKKQVATVKQVVGDAYVIVICRNPIKRIISSFRLLLEYGQQHKSQSLEEADKLFMKLIETDDIWIKRQLMYNEYVSTLDNYKAHFERVLLLSYDDVVKNPQKLLTDISEFTQLEFDSKSMLNFFNRKINSLSIKYSPGEDVTDRLNQLLEKQNEEIVGLLGTPLIY